jgi:hypothetical protein
VLRHRALVSLRSDVSVLEAVDRGKAPAHLNTTPLRSRNVSCISAELPSAVLAIKLRNQVQVKRRMGSIALLSLCSQRRDTFTGLHHMVSQPQCIELNIHL